MAPNTTHSHRDHLPLQPCKDSTESIQPCSYRGTSPWEGEALSSASSTADKASSAQCCAWLRQAHSHLAQHSTCPSHGSSPGSPSTGWGVTLGRQRYSRARSWGQALVHNPSAPLHKGAGRFVIDRGQCPNVADQLIQERRLDQIRLLGDERFLRQHDLLGGHRVRGEQAPVDVATVPQVGVVRVLQEAWRLVLKPLGRGSCSCYRATQSILAPSKSCCSIRGIMGIKVKAIYVMSLLYRGYTALLHQG